MVTNLTEASPKPAAPAATLLDLLLGFMRSQAIYVAAELSIPDLLECGPRSVDEIAAATGAQAVVLRRLLRALVAMQILTAVEEDRYALTELSALLRADVAGSLRGRALLFGQEDHWRAWGELRRAVLGVTERPADPHAVGQFGYYAAHPEVAAIFNEAMTGNTRQTVVPEIAALDFGGTRMVMDVGGGQGALIAAVLAANPDMRGTLIDLPHVVVGAGALPVDAGVAGRCTIVGGDFFTELPTGADVCLLKSVLHDWDDDRALAILRNCRRALSDDGRLWLIERLVSDGPTSSEAQAIALSDLVMLTLSPSGRERTAAEYRALLAAAGFAVVRVSAGRSVYSYIEAVAG